MDKLREVYDILSGIETTKDLKKNGFSLSDLQAARAAFNGIARNGSTQTYIKSVVDFFRRYGFTVSLNVDGVNYNIYDLSFFEA